MAGASVSGAFYSMHEVHYALLPFVTSMPVTVISYVSVLVICLARVAFRPPGKYSDRADPGSVPKTAHHSALGTDKFHCFAQPQLARFHAQAPSRFPLISTKGASCHETAIMLSLHDHVLPYSLFRSLPSLSSNMNRCIIRISGIALSSSWIHG
jgi:hypothetical protein